MRVIHARLLVQLFAILEPPFDCIDMTSPSKLLVTTRIKGVLAEGTEIELGKPAVFVWVSQ